MSAWIPAVLAFSFAALPARIRQEPVRLVMLGDSVTQSAAAAAGKKVSDYARTALNLHSSAGREWIVANEGVGRETAHGAWRRIAGILGEQTPDVVSLAYGFVDCRRKDPAWFEANVRKLGKAVADRDPEILVALLSTVPLDESIHVYGQDRFFIRYGGANRYLNNEINGRLREIAITEGLPFVDLFRYLSTQPGWRTSIRGDGIHPDETGNELIGAYVGRVLAACFAARVLNDGLALAREDEARDLVRKALRLFVFSRGRAVDECAAMEERAWNVCPYLPELRPVFTSLAAAKRGDRAPRPISW
jgi:lysophospholipase L1-like esterase